MTTAPQQSIAFEYAKYGFHDEEHYAYKSGKGLNEQVVRTLSRMKDEPAWMLTRRLKALAIYFNKPIPLVGTWANAKLAELDDQDIYYYVRPGSGTCGRATATAASNERVLLDRAITTRR